MTKIKTKTITLSSYTLKLIRESGWTISSLCRKVIDDAPDKLLRDYGKMVKTNIILNDKQMARLKRIKPYNLSKFLNDKVIEEINK